MKETVKENWYVTKPTAVSEIYDICWQSSIDGLLCQIRGGLDPDSIVLVTSSKKEAEKCAEELLHERDRQVDHSTKENNIIGYIYGFFVGNNKAAEISKVTGSKVTEQELKETLDKMLKLWSNR